MSAIPNLPEAVLTASASNGVNGTGHTNGHFHGSINGNGDAASPPEGFQLYDQPVENTRKIKVIVIGAGYSGIYMGIRIPEKLRNVELVIYEKNAGVGGVWWENRYPGCACDIPSYSYQYSFEPNMDWSSLYAPAREIQAYLQHTSRKYGADRFIKLSHKIKECRWDEDDGKWHVKVEDLENSRVFEDEAEVLVSARGNLNEIAWPEIEGLDSFQGEVMHSAKWNESYDFVGKKIGVIGSGSSSIQIVPNLQKLPGTQLSCFIRSKTWISPPFGSSVWEKHGLDTFTIPEELRAKFAADPDAYHRFRLAIEENGNILHPTTLRGTAMQVEGRKVFEKSMRERLSTHPEIFASLLPSFAPGCRRLTPGIGFLEALTQPNVSFISTPITQITSLGVLTSDSQHHSIDVLVCATGFHTSAPPPFPVIGTQGTSLQKHWATRATSYLSLAISPEFPNHFTMLGPNSAIGAGSLTMMIESTGDYVVRAIRKLQKDNIKSMAPRTERVRDFTAYVDAYFQRTVYTDDCRSWYRSKEGKISGLWPGSTLHCIETLRSPRWEDWEYVYLGEQRGGEEVNRMAWLGNGWSEVQFDGKDTAWYLYPEFMDKPLEDRPEEKRMLKIRPFSY
ncbi:hypothetical protein HDK64DRAFT_284292 [Phyllosticta capitalensis]|uniref:FAD/NAD(P)-binding domain-containing protein n=1 Tax=Phyllosticta capitalensis TaxID=121624 RepID=A0ABR1Z5Q9_9PEZI